ncbi:OLC1v1001461C1 [Oldenlandia corymbosa var. corymbosa]|nr:OLC1v1001461C1 [Oldenlandia corymbosa var. corymbosa]
MAFHVACPITCRRICYCELGFSRGLQSGKGKDEFLSQVFRIEEFVKDPWLLKAEANATVQVKVPKVAVVAPPPLPPPPVVVQRAAAAVIPARVAAGGGGISDADEAALVASAQTKRAALQKKAAAASLEAEDRARRFESGEMVGPLKDDTHSQEEQGLSTVKVMCRICWGGESEASERARKMLPCKSCGKKYHRSCLKAWSQNRDLFHWSSWTCPSCRMCEVCRRTGDPNKFMFCKRCDGAMHCYCLQPPHKNVSTGPYLCPKHTRCHSCDSSVPGNGLSVRWFLGYTCCDACGRLFVKGNYCPVCLKVYRDSEATPMVCCDVCQRWVHCHCDGISDSKYMQFQVDGNLQYVCPTCRGECHQIRSVEEAVSELWKRRNEADRDLIINLRAAAGLPIEDESFNISPFSDDEENTHAVLKNEHGRSLKFSLKGLADNSPKKNKEYLKKYSNKKPNRNKGHMVSLEGGAEPNRHLEREGNAAAFRFNVVDDDNEQKQSFRSGESDSYVSPKARSLTEGMCWVNQDGVSKHKFIGDDQAILNSRAPKKVKIKSNRSQGGDDSEHQTSLSRSTKGTKLVIHLGSRNRNPTSSPRSDGSSYQKDADITTSNGSEDGHPLKHGSVDRQDHVANVGDGKDQRKGSKLRGKEGNLVKIKKSSSLVTDVPSRFGGSKLSDGLASVSVPYTRASAGKRAAESASTGMRSDAEVLSSRGNKSSMTASDDISGKPAMSIQRESKPLLKLKIKNPVSENQISSGLHQEEERSIKRQRSKRKRPSPSSEKVPTKNGDNVSSVYEARAMDDEILDANWILQKLGRDAIGKRVEVHQPSDNSW